MSGATKEELPLGVYLKEIINKKLRIFEELVSWSEETYNQYEYLLSMLKKPYDKSKETTKSKGDRLENLVRFIIEKSYFFDVYSNIHTSTNEIDELIVLSDRGKQAIQSFDLSKDLLHIDDEIFIGECKNYDSNLSVTYVGKFYSLMIATDMKYGLIFTQEGLTGDREGYKDAYGLTKVLRIIEKYKNNKEFYILDFTLEDYEKIHDGKDFFKLIEKKKINLRTAANYQELLKENYHESTEKVKKMIDEINNVNGN